MANWFYVAGSLCFLAETVINMATTPKPVDVCDTPSRHARGFRR